MMRVFVQVDVVTLYILQFLFSNVLLVIFSRFVSLGEGKSSISVMTRSGRVYHPILSTTQVCGGAGNMPEHFSSVSEGEFVRKSSFRETFIHSSFEIVTIYTHLPPADQRWVKENMIVLSMTGQRRSYSVSVSIFRGHRSMATPLACFAGRAAINNVSLLHHNWHQHYSSSQIIGTLPGPSVSSSPPSRTLSLVSVLKMYSLCVHVCLQMCS